ncbi:MAG: elongation factor Ts [Patescibacteria group bacterium]
MNKIPIAIVKKLREETGAPIIRVQKVLKEVEGDANKAFEILQKEGFEKAETKGERVTGQGKVFSYAHHSGKITSVVELLCETDFVARNELFEELGKNIAMQVASMDPKDNKELGGQDFIKDPSQKISDLVKVVIAKTGENIRIGKIVRVELGK